MGVISVFLGVNLYVLIVGLFHKMFSDKHGGAKAFILGNVIILSALILGFLILY